MKHPFLDRLLIVVAALLFLCAAVTVFLELPYVMLLFAVVTAGAALHTAYQRKKSC